MLRALLITVAILAGALGGYLYWLHRAHAYIQVRSLTAPPPRRAAAPSTRILFVPGCERSFLVKVGELVEPQITPSSTPETLALATRLYGKPTRKSHSLIWSQDAFTLAEPAADRLLLTLETGHVVQTLDDIELGIDSFNAIRAKMRDRNLPVSDALVHGQHTWTYQLMIPSSCGSRWSSTYSRTLPETPDLDAQILPPANSPNPAPRAAAFFNRIASEYTLTRAQSQQR